MEAKAVETEKEKNKLEEEVGAMQGKMNDMESKAVEVEEEKVKLEETVNVMKGRMDEKQREGLYT